jgi:hypothetical protein
METFSQAASLANKNKLPNKAFSPLYFNSHWPLYQVRKIWFSRLDKTESMFYYSLKEIYREKNYCA